jgi:DNA-binding XRE family transcriptional regulator
MPIMAKKKRPSAAGNPWPKRLKKLRATLGLTQAEAAARADVALRTWISWENDHRQPGRITQHMLRDAFPEL